MLTYKKLKKGTAVYLEGKRVGTIRKVATGHQYFPSGKRTGGAVFNTELACKQSLELP